MLLFNVLENPLYTLSYPSDNNSKYQTTRLLRMSYASNYSEEFQGIEFWPWNPETHSSYVDGQPLQWTWELPTSSQMFIKLLFCQQVPTNHSEIFCDLGLCDLGLWPCCKNYIYIWLCSSFLETRAKKFYFYICKPQLIKLSALSTL